MLSSERYSTRVIEPVNLLVHAATMTVESELMSVFGIGDEEKDKVTKCQTIMTLYDLSVEDLSIKWESYVMTQANDPEMKVSIESLDKLQEYIQQSIRKKNQQNLTASAMKAKVRPGIRTNFNMSNLPSMGPPSTPSSSAKKRRLETPLSKSHGMVTSSPVSGGLAPSSDPVPATPETPLQSRQADSGTIIESLNPEIIDSAAEGLVEVSKPIKITAHFEDSKYNFRPMGQKLLEAADILDEQIETFTKVVQEHYQLPDDAFANPMAPSQKQVVVVGRVVPDSSVNQHNIRLDATSVFLEASRVAGYGERAQLKLDNIQNYSFFPGQIVALRGQNPDGSGFIVDEILQLPYLGSFVSSESDIEKYRENLNGSALKVVTCVGPYTRSDNFDLSALSAFVDRMNNEVHPHAIVMLGPFIDVTHPKIADGSISLPNGDPQTLDDIFTLAMTPVLRNLDQNTRVILVPSTKDATAKHPTYPQSGFDRKSLGLPRNFTCFPNPASFQLNDALFGVSNNDVVKDMAEVAGPLVERKNRFDRVAVHVMEQRRYYPVFPGGVKTRKIPGTETIEHISGADLDVPYLGLTELPEVIPDVLIMPSEMRYFARVVRNVITINPGVFMRPTGNGTYAVTHIKSPDPEDLEVAETDGDEKCYLHNVWKRARVDIVKT
ncbi:unnamed protein product [Kuraishia capsulata CBS 1993]|uniref:DNA polymerase alpha subunit B n=1 Tax=Kuraishia capsulata CBS 1993 TaxID=1382522 RepID=W6MHN6_9ASCO|nr:uncharacterized protein KUCA_T00001784001 [Kuraishia capsulata CBS 1993]CDK25814.1 unnamed protein product [Kuraishia capsulata CBS 1993]